MQSFARRHPIAAFLTLSYAVAAAIFAIPLLSSSGLGIIDLELPGTAPFILLAALSLAGAAFVTTALADGREGVRDLRRRVFRFRVHPAWYAATFLLPAAAVATAVALAGIEPLTELITSPGIVLGTVVAGALLAFLLVNWWEEAGWTGFVLHRLQPRIGPIAASVATTWLQAIVHLPLVFVVGGVTDTRVPPEQIPFYLAALFVLPISVRLVITWIYNASGRSVPIVGLYHAGLGVATSSGFVPVIAPSVDPVWVYAGFAVVAVLVLAVSRGRLGYEETDARPVSRQEMAVSA